MSKRRLSYEFLVACLAMLGGFALIWVDAPLIGLRGFQLPYEVGSALETAGSLGDEEAITGKRWLLWVLYLLPLGALAGLVLEPLAWKHNRSGRRVRLVVPLLWVFALVVVAASFAFGDTWVKSLIESIPDSWLPSPIEVMGPGVWVTLGAIALGLASVWTTKKAGPQSDPAGDADG